MTRAPKQKVFSKGYACGMFAAVALTFLPQYAQAQALSATDILLAKSSGISMAGQFMQGQLPGFVKFAEGLIHQKGAAYTKAFAAGMSCVTDGVSHATKAMGVDTKNEALSRQDRAAAVSKVMPEVQAACQRGAMSEYQKSAP